MSLQPEIKIFSTTKQLVQQYTQEFVLQIVEAGMLEQEIFIALSGGNTPKILFDHIVDVVHDKIKWEQVHFFWVDERCVPPEDNQSNFGMTKKHLLDHIPLEEWQIHRIQGESPPGREVKRYAKELNDEVPKKNGLPMFDIMLLGLGEDGHTASIFPDQMKLLEEKRFAANAVHPETGQQRVTLTGPVINNAKRIVFFVSGKKKAGVVASVLQKTGDCMSYPAAYIKPSHGSIAWYLDKDAAHLLEE